MFRIVLSCAVKNMRAAPSRRENNNVPSRAVEKKNSTRPFPSWKKLYTVLFRRESYMHRPVPSGKKIYRPVPS